MKNKLMVFMLVVLALFVVACGNSNPTGIDSDSSARSIGVVGENAEVWREVADRLQDQDIQLEIVEFSDFTAPNKALSEGEIDMASFQTERSMQMFNEETANDLQVLGHTILAPMGVYSDKYTSLDEIPDGGLITIPNDNSSFSRAINLLVTSGLIEVDPGADYPSIADITSNPKNLEFKEIDSSQTASTLQDVDAAIINNGMAVDAGFDPANDSIFLEPADESSAIYYNVTTTIPDYVDDPVIQAIVKEYETEPTREKLKEIYGEAAVVVF